MVLAETGAGFFFVCDLGLLLGAYYSGPVTRGP